MVKAPVGAPGWPTHDGSPDRSVHGSASVSYTQGAQLTRDGALDTEVCRAEAVHDWGQVGSQDPGDVTDLKPACA